MQIIIHRVSQEIQIEINVWNTILEVKQQIHDKQGISINQQILIYGGKQLENDQTICKYEIQQNANIYLVVCITD